MGSGERDDALGLAALSVALDERDRPTSEHCDRVQGLSLELGIQCGLSHRELEWLRLAARLHDVGKIGIPDSVLKKSSPLDEQDWIVMRTHASRSERIIAAADLEDAAVIAKLARHHHEQFDGLGYPDGLAGEGIPALSRMIAIVDSYDAMASLRAHGPNIGHQEIMEELARVAGTQHDPYLSAKFAVVIQKSRFRARH